MSTTHKTPPLIERMARALQAYVLTIDYMKRTVNPEEWETHGDWASLRAAADEVLALYEVQCNDVNDTRLILQTLPLPAALWWFIENVADDDRHRSDLFFLLRERMRNETPTQYAPEDSTDG